MATSSVTPLMQLETALQTMTHIAKVYTKESETACEKLIAYDPILCKLKDLVARTELPLNEWSTLFHEESFTKPVKWSAHIASRGGFAHTAFNVVGILLNMNSQATPSESLLPYLPNPQQKVTRRLRGTREQFIISDTLCQKSTELLLRTDEPFLCLHAVSHHIRWQPDAGAGILAPSGAGDQGDEYHKTRCCAVARTFCKMIEDVDRHLSACPEALDPYLPTDVANIVIGYLTDPIMSSPPALRVLPPAPPLPKDPPKEPSKDKCVIQ